MIKTTLLPCNLTTREIIKTGFWYANGKRTQVITEKEMCEFEQKLARAQPEHLLLILTTWIEGNKAMPSADALYEALFNQHEHCPIQKRFILRIEEARERQQQS